MRLCSPKTNYVVSGNNRQIRLSTTAAGLFEGEYFNSEAHCYET